LVELGRMIHIKLPGVHSSRAFSGSHPEQVAKAWPMRLRALQWGGRPGKLLHKGYPLVGTRVMIEWALPNMLGWPLPPTNAPARGGPCSVVQPLSSVVRIRAHSMPLLRTWLPCADPTPFDSGEPERVVLVRIVSLLLPHEIWMEIDLDATLGTFYKDVASIFRRESPMFSDLCKPLHIELAIDPKVVRSVPMWPESQIMRDMFWAQSETIGARVDFDHDGARQSDALTKPLLIRIWRVPAFDDAPLKGSPLPHSRELAQFETGIAWTRQLSDPIPMQGRESSQLRSATTFSSSAWTRQNSEPARHNSWWDFLDQCSSPSADMLAGPLSDDDEFPLSAGRPQLLSRHHVGRHGHLGDAALHDDDFAAPLDGGSWERVVPHYPPRLLAKTLRTRQFEFHPSMPNLMLLGDRKGCVSVLDTETEEMNPPLQVASCPLLGLVWMRYHPQVAVCGASHSGDIMFLKYDPNARMTEPSLQRPQCAESFPKLSSLSANCTDDFLLASGISPNIAVYDVQTAKVLCRAHGVHEHFINISRFCNTSPHIFATASFDHTCKIWDLRQPLTHDAQVKTLNTGGHNVMCVFSPDDKHVLCSGVDTRIMQFEVPSWRQSPEHFPLREAVHRERYRRSTYLSDGGCFVTAATEESHMHLMSVHGKKLGVVDFRGVVQNFVGSGSQSTRGVGYGGSSITSSGGGGGSSSITTNQATSSCIARLAGGLPSHLDTGRSSWLSLASSSPHALQQNSLRAAARHGAGLTSQHHRCLSGGAIQLDDASPSGGSSRNSHEFVQSIRAHPTVRNRVGVLLCETQGDTSYVALVDLSCR